MDGLKICKECKECGKTKSVISFRRSKHGGYEKVCKACIKAKCEDTGNTSLGIEQVKVSKKQFKQRLLKERARKIARGEKPVDMFQAERFNRLGWPE